jgi:uncharacterized protein
MISWRKIRLLPGLIAAFGLALWPAAAAPATAPASAVEAAKPEPRPEARTAPRPAIWLLADADTRIYLFGTVHMLPPGLRWRSAAFEQVVREADELVLEVAEDPDPAEIRAIVPLIMRDRPLSILERVSPDRREALREMVVSLGIPLETFDGMHTWAAAMSIAVAGLRQTLAGPDGSPEDVTGVEDELRVDFSRSGRPIFGVEDGARQLGFFAALSARTQREMLEEMIDAFAAGDPDYGEVSEEGWLRGDTDDIAAEMEAMPAELFELLVTRRNTAWTAWLVDRLERPGTVLFAVGAGHLAGRDSVQSMLADRGLTVTRLD